MIEKIRNNKIISISLILFVYLLAFISGYVSYKYIPIENILLKFFLCDIIGTIVVYLGGVSLNNASVYDPYWSILPMILVPFFINETIGFNVYTSIIMVFVEIWGLRLTMNWFLRFKNLKIQDWRYTHIQNKHPKLWPLISFFGIHILPTIVVFMGLLPVFAYVDAFEKKVEINGTYFISCIVCFIAIVIEMLADAQMNTFKKNPENVGKINRNGLWKKSRHPNYFGEILFWFSMFLFNLSVRSDLWILIFCPLIIFLLFISVSIPMLEKRQANNKVGYLEYKKETNIFCVATFSVALLNIVLNIIFLDRYFNDTRELFQDSGLNYGHVALCNSLIILGISTLLIWGCDNYLKVLKWSVYIMLAFQLAEIVVEFSFLNTILNIREFWYVIMAQLSRQKFDVFIMN